MFELGGGRLATTAAERERFITDALKRYLGDSDVIVQRSLRRYAIFMKQCRDGTVNRRWERLTAQNGMFLYKESTQTTSIEDIRANRPTIMSERALRACVPHGRSTYVSAFGGGEISGSLRDVMEGLYASDGTSHRQNCEIQYGNISDCGIMKTFEEPDSENPFRYLGVKWLEMPSNDDSSAIDEIYWLERTGIHTTKSGSEYGYQMIKSVDFEDDHLNENGSMRSIHLSVCYLYHQVEAEVVHVFARGIIEIPHTADSNLDDIYERAGKLLLGPARGRASQRVKVISNLIDKSKSEREKLMACRCSKVIPGIPRVDLCSDCRRAMRRCKLLAINNVKSGASIYSTPRRSSTASTATTSSSTSTGSLANGPLLRQARCGLVRHDGQPPKTSPPKSSPPKSPASSIEDGSISEDEEEPFSLRMFLPIHDPLPDSDYRMKKQADGNILVRMLERYETQRRSRAADRLPPTS